MNGDLYTLLLFLSFAGIFLAVVVGRLQFSQDDELHREVADKLKAVKSLEEDYRKQSEVAEKLGAYGRSEILPMIGHASSEDKPQELTPGRLFRQALAIYEAIEHVDDPERADPTYQKTVDEFGLEGPSELQRSDLRSMLRLARISIHAKSQGATVETYKNDLRDLLERGELPLSEGGQLRLREVLTMLHREDMKALTEEYRLYIPVIEELLLSSPAHFSRDA